MKEYPPGRDKKKERTTTKGRGRRAAHESKRSGGGTGELPKVVHPIEPASRAEVSKNEAATPSSVSATERFETLGSVPGAQDVKKAYIELGKKLQGMGIKPWMMPANAPELTLAWDRANAALDRTKKLSEKYEKELDPARRVEIAADIRRLEINLLGGGRISKGVEAAAEAFREKEVEAVIGETWDRIPPGEQNKVPAQEPEEQAVAEPAPEVVPPTENIAAEEAPFDPHSVPGMDGSNIVAPQYAPHDMQEHMEKLNGEPEPETGAEEVRGIVPSERKREFHEDGSEYVDFAEGPAKAEDTRAGWKKQLSDLISEAKGKLYEVKEKASELFNKSKEFLTNEDTTLAEKAKTLGKGAEEMLLALGEQYRKAPLKYKLALSAALIGGSIATGGASTFVTILSAAKLGQRSAASLGVYALVNGLMEKRLAGKEEKGETRGRWDTVIKQFVSGGAALAVFSGLPGLALKEGFEAAGGGRVIDWLGGMLGHAPAGSVPVAGAAAVAEAVPGAPAAAAAAAFEIPSVGASSHGYEGMLKDLISKLPNNPPPGVELKGDLAELYAAKAHPELLEKTLYNLAKEHKFLVGSESVRIDPTAHMTVVNGQLHLADAAHPGGVFDAASDMRILHAHAEASISADLPVEPVPTLPEIAPGPDLTAAQDLAQQHIDAANQAAAAAVVEPNAPPPFDSSVLHDSSGNAVVDGSGNPIHTGTYEQPAPAGAHTPVESSPAPDAPIAPDAPPTPMIEHAQEFINSNKLSIDPLHGHVFTDSSGAALAYGNDFPARFDAAQEFVKAHHDAVVWVQAEKTVFMDNEWRPWVFQVKYSGFGPFGSVQAIIPADGMPNPSQIGAINPDSFIQQLDK